MKRLLKALIAIVAIFSGLFMSLVLLFDWKKEWLFEKYGKDEVVNFMKRFEPYIVLQPSDLGEEAEEVHSEGEEGLDAYADSAGEDGIEAKDQ